MTIEEYLLTHNIKILPTFQGIEEGPDGYPYRVYSVSVERGGRAIPLPWYQSTSIECGLRLNSFLSSLIAKPVHEQVKDMFNEIEIEEIRRLIRGDYDSITRGTY